MSRYWATLPDTPIGALSFAVDENGLARVVFGVVDEPIIEIGELPALGAVAGQLRAYFAGELTEFTLPLTTLGGSGFERAVWAELSRIPYGQTHTYGQVAAAIGEPDAARAVGVACNRNPHPVVVPCHRVVGAGGKLVGFGGGLPRKRVLLELEARVAMQREWAG